MIYQIVRNEQDAWDIAQDGFVKAWKSIQRFKGDAAFTTWLHRIMANTAIDWMRKRKREPTAEFDDRIAVDPALTPEVGAGPDPSPARKLEQSELGLQIHEAIGRLSDDHRAVIVMKEIEGMQYHEIADAMGCTIGTVMSRLFYARKKLQSLLGDAYEQL